MSGALGAINSQLILITSVCGSPPPHPLLAFLSLRAEVSFDGFQETAHLGPLLQTTGWEGSTTVDAAYTGWWVLLDGPGKSCRSIFATEMCPLENHLGKQFCSVFTL